MERQIPEHEEVILPLARLRWEPLRETVYRSLRDAIMSAHWEPGTSLTVRSVAETLGISTMPVRSAFSRLVAERALQTEVNGGVMVPRLTRDHFNELEEARILLEGAAGERAAGLINKEELASLESLSDAISVAVKTGSRDYVRLNQTFKFEVVAAARYPVLADLIERLWLQVGPFMHYYVRDISAQADTDEYAVIVDALKSGDGPAARAAMERDVRAGWLFLAEHGTFADGE